MDLSSVFDKKVGDFNKKESESFDFTGLKIPRDYIIFRRLNLMKVRKLLSVILAILILVNCNWVSVYANEKHDINEPDKFYKIENIPDELKIATAEEDSLWMEDMKDLNAVTINH